MFRPYKNLPMGNQDYLSYIIGNSQTIAIGDALIVGTAATSSFVYGAGTASTVGTSDQSKILGVCVGFLPINQTGSSVPTQELSSVTVPSSNQTVAQIRAKFIPARLVDLWVADLNVATGTTTGSAGAGYFNIDGNGTLLESSYRTPETAVLSYGASTASFVSMGAASNFGPNWTTSQVVGAFNLYV